MQNLAMVSNCVIKNEEFLKEVESVKKFTHTTKTSREVADSLRSAKPVKLSTYKTKSPFSKVIATTYKSDRTHVYFNLRKNPRKMESLVNTSFHEALHLLGHSHGDNSPIGKSQSVPYLIGKIAETYAQGCLK
jgi:prolyl-tRNA editing enzyme YbaK/EbsC (Cys-tRNA(Pro) deacylase)